MKSGSSVSTRRNIGEAAFVFAMLLSTFGIALEAKANLGISMIEAPAYLLSLKMAGLSFGMGEWIWQGFLLVLCCTLICTVINAPLIALFGRLLDRYLRFDAKN